MKKVMLGFAGEMGAGKGTATELMKVWFPGTESFRFSDSLREFSERFRVIHLKKKDDVPWIFFRETLAEALGVSFGNEVVSSASPEELAIFAQWLLGEFVSNHKGMRSWLRLASTPELQDISTKVRATFGEDALEKAVIAKSDQSASESPIVVIEGIRRLVDIGRLMQNSNFHLVYIEADREKRHDRHKKRNEKPGDADLTLEQFTKLGEAEAEQQTRLLKPYAHVVIVNNGTQDEFAHKLYTEISPWFAR